MPEYWTIARTARLPCCARRARRHRRRDRSPVRLLAAQAAEAAAPRQPVRLWRARQLCQGALLRGPPPARLPHALTRARASPFQIFGKHPILWLLPTNQGIEGNGIFYELSVESQAGPGEKLW